MCVCMQAFSVVFDMAIMRTEPAEEVKQRVNNLIDEITYSVFMYTNRSLFEKDKLTFTAQIAFQVCLGLAACVVIVNWTVSPVRHEKCSMYCAT